MIRIQAKYLAAAQYFEGARVFNTNMKDQY